jgi:hypothetical protein
MEMRRCEVGREEMEEKVGLGEGECEQPRKIWRPGKLWKKIAATTKLEIKAETKGRTEIEVGAKAEKGKMKESRR